MLCSGTAASSRSSTYSIDEVSLPSTSATGESRVVRNRSNVWCSRSPLIAPAVKAGAMKATNSISIATMLTNSVRPISPTLLCPLTLMDDSATARYINPVNAPSTTR